MLNYSTRHERKDRKPIFDGCISSEGEQTANKNGSTLTNFRIFNNLKINTFSYTRISTNIPGKQEEQTDNILYYH